MFKTVAVSPPGELKPETRQVILFTSVRFIADELRAMPGTLKEMSPAVRELLKGALLEATGAIDVFEDHAGEVREPMTVERFNTLLAGPLSHPLVPFRLTRLAHALLGVVQATGAAGARALEAHCAARDQRDRSVDEHAAMPGHA